MNTDTNWTDAVTDFTAPEKLRDFARRLERLVKEQHQTLMGCIGFISNEHDEKICVTLKSFEQLKKEMEA